MSAFIEVRSAPSDSEDITYPGYGSRSISPPHNPSLSPLFRAEPAKESASEYDISESNQIWAMRLVYFRSSDLRYSHCADARTFPQKYATQDCDPLNLQKIMLHPQPVRNGMTRVLSNQCFQNSNC